MILTAAFMAKQSGYPLQRSFILDSGSTCHVANDIARFTYTRPATTGDFLWAGNTRVWIKAYGTVIIRVARKQSTTTLQLYNVAYCPDLHCNLVSFRILRNQGLWWDTKSNPTILRRLDDSTVAILEEQHNQWVIEYNDPDALKASYHTSAPKRLVLPRQRAEALTWHKRMGHPGPSALEHLVQQSEGVKVIGVPTVKCDACGISKSKRLISRRPRTILESPGERVAIDFHDYEEGSTTKEKSQMLIVCRVTGILWDFYFTDNRTARSIIKHLETFVTFMKNQFNVMVKVIEADNEIFSVKAEVHKWAQRKGIKIEPSAPDTQAQNGGAERSGGVVKEKGRAMRLGANLPWNLWPEIARASVYLHNRTPKYTNHWKSPYEMFFTSIAFKNGVVTSPRKPNQSHLRAYGCKAFAMTDDTKRGKSRLQRFDPKAWIGYLVGYQSSNIFRIWIPSMGKVISTRDVVFDEDTIFSGAQQDIMDNLMHSTVEEIATWVRIVELPPPSNPQEEDLGSFYEDETIDQALSQSLGTPQYDQEGRKVMLYPTPPTTPPPAGLLAQLMTRDPRTEFGGEEPIPLSTAEARKERGKSGWHSSQEEARKVHGETEARKERQRLDPHSGQSGRQSSPEEARKEQGDAQARKERQRQDPHGKGTDPWAAAFMAGMKAGHIQKIDGRVLDSAKLERMLRAGKLPHRSELPPVPTSIGLRKDHPLYELFKKAEASHLQSHRETKSWTEVPAQEARKGRHQILDSMWVYTYKLDKHHRFQKCKARLVVRGDQQKNVTAQDTYAATLAGRSFRMLAAIAARFDLELKQYDVTNAFVHADIDRPVYMKMPRGYARPGTILRLNKALYGLRISPLLWQRHFTTFLTSLGFKPVPHEPCCMIRDGIFIFFYVDDIIIAYHKRNEAAAEGVVKDLKKKYSLTGGKDLQWFLGLEVIRDRPNRRLWLSQAAYVEKIARLADKLDIRHDTPMGRTELLPREGLATPSEINRYQRKIGSLLFAAVNTRPDVAFSVSRLARFLANPGPAHQHAADRVLLYLRSTKGLAILFGGSDVLIVASDASFADNTIDRKSSQGYAIKLFGGLIAWRANKQDTVTTSTTEAELLALSQVAKEAIFTRMLLTELGIELHDPTITIQCDNTQTIRLINEEISQLTTKLRHVDIHNHWLRQEAKKESIRVTYVQSSDMIADGLTKALAPNQWAQFLEQVGLEDVTERLAVPEGDLDEIADKIKAIEIDEIPPAHAGMLS